LLYTSKRAYAYKMLDRKEYVVPSYIRPFAISGYL